MSTTVNNLLTAIELTQYAEQFKINDIAGDQLIQLTDNDLINIGVTSLGHRMRILNAAREFSKPDNQLTSSAAFDHLTERRQLTVMFCDLADSSHLANILDPEDLREVIRAYQATAAEVIEKYEGHIAQYLGDGIMVYFGYPIAHEDDAIRAAHTALELPVSIRELNQKIIAQFNVSISLRIGISTGDVIVGQIGAHNSSEVLATGTTPNEAAHYQQLADLNSNVISHNTRELIGDHFNVCEVNSKAKQHKSLAKYCITGKSNTESRFKASRTHSEIAMIGRDNQLSQLKTIWATVAAEKSSTVLVHGEAGIGKSKIVQALIDSLHFGGFHRIVFQCSPYHIDTPLYPAIHYLNYIAQITASDNDETKLQKIRNFIQRTSTDSNQATELLTELLGITNDAKGNSVLKHFSAKEKREQLMQLLVEMLATLSKSQPVLFVIEDTHWIDDTTQTFLEFAQHEFTESRILMLLTARPEYDANWITKSVAHQIELTRLSKNSTEQVVHQLSNNKAFPNELLTHIVSKTDGVPLFIEELTKNLLESNLLNEDENGYLLKRDINDLDIPSTLQDSLMARLDKLNIVKEIAQVASCVGRNFQTRDISAAMEHNENYIDIAITQLLNADLVSSASTGNGIVFSFKHALVSDVAYASLPKSRKKIVHKNLFNFFRNDNCGPELLAFHANEAGLKTDAIHHWEAASSRAIKRAAFSEAIAHLDKAIECTHQLEDTIATRKKELELLVQQGHASTALHGFAHPNTVGINVKARALLDRVKDSPLRFPVLYGHWLINHAVGQHPTALIDATEMQGESNISRNRVQQIMAHRSLASTQTMMGNFDVARTGLEKSLALYDAKKDVQLAWQYNLDPTVPARIYSALCCVCTGEGDTAAKLVKDVDSFTKELGHPHTRIYALSHLALTAQIGRWSNRKHYIDLTNEFVEKHDLMAYRGHALGIEAMMLYEHGQLEASEQIMKKSLDVITNTKTHIYSPLLYANYAACLADLHLTHEANGAAETALALADENSEFWAKAEILRLLAHTEWIANNNREAQMSRLQESIEYAEQQSAHMWSIRSTTSLAKLHQELGNSTQAKSLLQRKIDLFSNDGRTLFDWHAASRLLSELDT